MPHKATAVRWPSFENSSVVQSKPNPIAETITVNRADLRALLRAQEVAAEAALNYEVGGKLPDARHVAIWREHAQQIETRLRRQIETPFE